MIVVTPLSEQNTHQVTVDVARSFIQFHYRNLTIVSHKRKVLQNVIKQTLEICPW